MINGFFLGFFAGFQTKDEHAARVLPSYIQPPFLPKFSQSARRPGWKQQHERSIYAVLVKLISAPLVLILASLPQIMPATFISAKLKERRIISFELTSGAH